jgi:hypothetical protein
MTDALVTAVDAVITRVLIMEALAVTDSVSESRRWVEFNQDWPYWVNRPGGLAGPTGPEDMPEYELTIIMRLVLAYHASAHREDEVSGNVQDKAWEYEASVMRYFELNNLLNPSGYDPINWVGRCSITCPIGLDLKILPLARDIFLAIDFNLTVPITIGQEVT